MSDLVENDEKGPAPFIEDPRFRRQIRLISIGGPILAITLFAFALFGPNVEPGTRITLTFAAMMNFVFPIELELRIRSKPGIFASAVRLARRKPYRGLAVFAAVGTFLVTPIFASVIVGLGLGTTGLLVSLGIYLVIELYVVRVALGFARAAGGREVVVTDNRIYGPTLRPSRKVPVGAVRARLLYPGLGSRSHYDYLFEKAGKTHRRPTAAEKAAFIEAFAANGPEATLYENQGIVDVDALRGVLAGEIPIEWALAYADGEADTPTLPGDDATGRSSTK